MAVYTSNIVPIKVINDPVRYIWKNRKRFNLITRGVNINSSGVVIDNKIKFYWRK